MKPEDWERLDTRDVAPGRHRIERALLDLYGIRGRLDPLESERETVLRVTTPAGIRHVARVTQASESREALALQHRALASIAARDPALRVPRVLPSFAGREIERIDNGQTEFALRVLAYVPGRPISGQRPAQALRGIGIAAARLDRALASMPLGAARPPLLWDIMHPQRIMPLVRRLQDSGQRELVEEVLSAFCERGLKELSELPRQVVHNDLSPKNVLFEDQDDSRVSGIIDFGDIIEAPRIVDLGVAIARFMDPSDPIRSSGELVAGYSMANPLTDAELRATHRVVLARLAMRVAIWSWRRARGPRDASDASIAEASRHLQALHGVSTERLVAAWRDDYPCNSAP